MMKIREQNKKPIYFDVCALCRPYDDQSYHRIEMETLAVVMITTLIKNGKYALFFAPVHESELAGNTEATERIEILKLLYDYGQNLAETLDDYNALEKRAIELGSNGFGVADAFHVAYAEQVGASFITCDDALLRKCSRNDVIVWSGTPVDFCKKEGYL
jgi:predicted nucleic acid-binding protein